VPTDIRVVNSRKRRSIPSRAAASDGNPGKLDGELTAGDLARLLRVDLKTIHNWVNQGHVWARRTEGRHLRFQRVEVVRFLRQFRHPVPADLGSGPPRVLVHVERSAIRIPNVEQTSGRGLIATVLEVALGAYEVVVFSLDSHDARVTRELLGALRARPETRSLSLVGVSKHPARRADFVDAGGDLALAPGKTQDMALAVRFLIGASAAPPRGAAVRRITSSA
jgi:excisionase family DNA binding protein